jgi:hypothetical protein
MERVKSNDVLDPTHVARRPFRGKVIGYFRRIGPNAWDDYQFIRSAASDATQVAAASDKSHGSDLPQSQEILPQVPLQLESHRAEVRVRSNGRVVRVRWLPDLKDEATLGADAEPGETRRYFIETCLLPLGAEAVLGATAVMVKKLGDL